MNKQFISFAFSLVLISGILSSCATDVMTTPDPTPTPSQIPTPIFTSSPLPTAESSTEPLSYEYALYDAYLESGDWAWLESMEEGRSELEDYNSNGDYKIIVQKLFDFDGDGTLDLWYKAQDLAGVRPKYIPTISGFCTITDGKVERLCYGYISGGSIGGDFIKTMFNQETSEYVVLLRGSWGGFGGWANSGYYYSMKNGGITEIERLYITSYFREEGDEVIYEVNDEKVSEEVYDRAIGKYIEPTDSDYALEEWPW